jgi:hypothetical protein
MNRLIINYAWDLVNLNTGKQLDETRQKKLCDSVISIWQAGDPHNAMELCRGISDLDGDTAKCILTEAVNQLKKEINFRKEYNSNNASSCLKDALKKFNIEI